MATTQFLSRDEICPSVDLGSCFRITQNIWHNYRLPGHHLILIEHGKIRAGTPAGNFEARGGDLICFRPTEFNGYGSFGDTMFYQAHVLFAPPPRHDLTPWLDDIGPLPVRSTLGDSYDDARRVFETICLELTLEGPQHPLRIKAALFELLAIIAGVSKRQSPGRARQLDPWQRVKMRLESELSGTPRIDELAARVGVSTEHFVRRFKERFGSSPRAYHTQLRLREAARLLRDPQRPVKNVSYALGFPDPRAFARLLKRHTGLKPSDLRLSTPPPQRTESLEAKGRLIPINQHLVPFAIAHRRRPESIDPIEAWERKWRTMPRRK